MLPYAIRRLRTWGKTPPEGSHLILAVADHFEPSIEPERPSVHAPLSVQRSRLERWCRERPGLLDRWRDVDGRPFMHTFFYPAEQYDTWMVDRLAEHCHQGWGELEIHLHHGIEEPSTAEETRRQLEGFRDELRRRGCLARWADDSDRPAYGFVHGNWALANSAGGRYCGVDDEMAILRDTGCYADFTLPSAPNRAQVPKVNALYECRGSLERRAPHARGVDLEVGSPPKRFPLILTGPLMLDFGRISLARPWPGIENGALTGRNPGTSRRIRMWIDAHITVRGRPDWIFVKLHCHGMDPRDESAMLGSGLTSFLSDLFETSRQLGLRLHFTTAREMTNMVLAACDGREGDPNEYRDYRILLDRND